PTSLTSADQTNLTTGRTTAITATTTRARRSMCPTMLSAMRISMTTETGATIRTTAMSGFPTGLPQVGRLITKATGTGSLPGDTPGSMTLPGAMRRSTTDAG